MEGFAVIPPIFTVHPRWLRTSVTQPVPARTLRRALGARAHIGSCRCARGGVLTSRPRLRYPTEPVKSLTAILRPIAAAGALLAASLAPSVATAQTAPPRYYVVVNGDTLWDLARRFHVSASELAERSHLEAPYALRRGMRLRLPSRALVVPEAAEGASAHPAPVARPAPAAHPAPAARPTPAANDNRRPGGRWGRPAHPGVVHLKRVADDQRVVVDLRRIGPVTRQRMRTFLRASNGATHAIDPRLMRQVAMFSDHFGGRTVEVISCFRPRRRAQYTPHSRHNLGHAIDFRIEGVSNRATRDYCRTFANTGCGFYPRSVFIHMDTRDASAYWVDWSRPGERPRYGSESHPPPAARPRGPTANPIDTPDPSVPPAGADPELDDVADDTPAIRTAQPPTEHHDDTSADPDALPTGP